MCVIRKNTQNIISHISIFQQIVNSSWPFFYRYNISWYLSSLYIQKLVLFLLQRSNKIYTMNAGKLFTASLECFATVKLFYLFIHFTYIYSMYTLYTFIIYMYTYTCIHLLYTLHNIFHIFPIY